MVAILKGGTRLRVKEFTAPAPTTMEFLGGVDALTMPDSHLSCPMCRSPWWECWIHKGDKHNIQVGCMKCGYDTRILIPRDIPLDQFAEGRFTCFKHPNAGMAIIHNTDVLCIGCQNCKSEVRLKLKTNTNLVVM